MFILQCEVYLLEQFKSGLQQWCLNTAAHSHLLTEVHIEEDALFPLFPYLARLMYNI